jgi:hypothetical protein
LNAKNAKKATMDTKFGLRGTLMTNSPAKVDAATKTAYDQYKAAYDVNPASGATATKYTAYKIKEDAFLNDATKLNSDK